MGAPDGEALRGDKEMKYLAAIVAFVATYFVVSFAYAELAPFALASYFRDRQALLGSVLFVICLTGAGVAFLVVG
jgi:putative exporter of polyketide antibiotics